MNKLYTILLCLIATQALAEEKEKPFKASAEFGAISTSGNTSTVSLLGKFDAKHELTRWKNHYILEALYKEDEVQPSDPTAAKEKQTTAEKYFASAQADYKLAKENSGLFVFGSHEVDKFSGYDYQSTFALGYSDRLLNTKRSIFEYSVGPGYSVSETEETFSGGIFIPSERLESFIVRLSALYSYQISENAKFTQTVSSDVVGDSDKNTKTKSNTAISANINSSFALKASLTVSYNSIAPVNKKHADTQTAVTLVYSF